MDPELNAGTCPAVTWATTIDLAYAWAASTGGSACGDEDEDEKGHDGTRLDRNPGNGVGTDPALETAPHRPAVRCPRRDSNARPAV